MQRDLKTILYEYLEKIIQIFPMLLLGGEYAGLHDIPIPIRRYMYVGQP